MDENTSNTNAPFLLVDDNRPDLQIMGMALEKVAPNAAIKFFDSGPEVIAHVQDEQPGPKAVFLDLGMPEMDGREVLQILREKENLQCPIFVFSGLVTAKLTDELSLLGATEVFEKPFGFDGTIDLFNQILEANQLL